MLTTDYSDSFQASATGFSVEIDGVRRQFDDTAVCGLRVIGNSSDASAGSYVKERLEIRVREEGGGQRVIGITNEYRAGDINLLEEFRDRLLEEVLVNLLEELRGGGEIEGTGWRMSLTQLTIVHSGQTVPLDEIVAATWQQDLFCLWNDAAGEPFAGFDRDGENAHLLPRLLEFFVKDQVEPSADMLRQGAGLGTLLSEFQDASPRVKAMMGIIGGIGGVVLLLTLNFGLRGEPLFLAIAVGDVVFMAVALGILHFKFGKSHLVQHFENALILNTGEEETVLPMSELKGFSAKWTDHYYNGRYNGTSIEMAFFREGGEKAAIDLGCHCNRSSDKYARLETLQQHAASLVAQRMADELQETGRVQWTEKLAIRTDGLEHRKRPGAEPELLAYHRISRFEAKNGTLKVWVDGNWMATITQPANDVNFFPGLALIETLSAEDERELPPPQPQDAGQETGVEEASVAG